MNIHASIRSSSPASRPPPSARRCGWLQRHGLHRRTGAFAEGRMLVMPLLMLAGIVAPVAGAGAQPAPQSPAASRPASAATEPPQAPVGRAPAQPSPSSEASPSTEAPQAPVAGAPAQPAQPPQPSPSSTPARAAAAVEPGRSGPAQTDCACEEEPATDHVLEVTFGSAQLFNRHSTVTRSGTVDTEIIPVSSALLMVEWLFMRQVSAVMLATLPLEEQAVLIDGELRYEFAAPSLSLGMRGTPLGFDAFWDSTVELQLAAFVGRTLGSASGDVFFPLVAGRVHIRTAEGFALYLGSAFAFERDTLALIYGIGHRF